MGFDIPKKISRMRTLIAEAVKRIEADGYFDEHGARRVAMVVEKESLVILKIYPNPVLTKSG